MYQFEATYGGRGSANSTYTRIKDRIRAKYQDSTPKDHISVKGSRLLMSTEGHSELEIICNGKHGNQYIPKKLKEIKK